MKHPEFQGELNRLLQMAGLSIGESNILVLVQHLEWLLEETKRVNLTSISDPPTALRLHTLDALAALPEIEDAPSGRLLDIGTGGGFPGLPLAVAANRHALLLDSVKKKASALQAFVDEANLAALIQIGSIRAEELAATSPGQFSVVTARAVGELPALVELAAPLLGDSGVLVALKAQIQQDELDRGVKVGALVGMTMTGMRTLRLLEGGEERSIITFRRTSTSKVPLPRRTGLAQKRPLS